MSADTLFVSKSDTGLASPEPGLRRQMMAANDKLMLVRHRMDAGWVGKPHAHPHEQLVYILAGAISLSMQGETHHLRAGDSLIVPGGVEHHATASEASEVLDVFTPAREDYR